MKGVQTGLTLIKLPRLSREFLRRAGLVVVFVAAAYQLPWEWLRFFTSECVLRISALLGMPAARASFDTIQVGSQAFQFVIPCTFVDVFMGSIPLLWDLRKSVAKNVLGLIAAAMVLFVFNVVRLEFAQVLYYRGVSWILADEVLGGIAYFAIWLAIWRLRSWNVRTSHTELDALRGRA